MKTLGLLAALLVAAMNGYTQTTLADFKVMAGCWESRDDSKKLLISEQWMTPAGTSILGSGRTVKNDKTTDWEFMRIEQRPDGIFYVAKPKANAAETDFKLISTDTSRFVFENKAHDFPQRVIYTVTKDTFTGRIEGEMNGKSRGIDFPMKRTRCE